MAKLDFNKAIPLTLKLTDLCDIGMECDFAPNDTMNMYFDVVGNEVSYDFALYKIQKIMLRNLLESIGYKIVAIEMIQYKNHLKYEVRTNLPQAVYNEISEAHIKEIKKIPTEEFTTL